MPKDTARIPDSYKIIEHHPELLERMRKVLSEVLRRYVNEAAPDASSERNDG